MYQYLVSAWLRGDNTLENAKRPEYGGALDARELYPDIKAHTLEELMYEYVASSWILGTELYTNKWEMCVFLLENSNRPRLQIQGRNAFGWYMYFFLYKLGNISLRNHGISDFSDYM